MNLLTKAELVAEFVFTCLFKKSVKSIQPVEIAKEMIKAMLKNKQVSISTVYVPNVYRVFLNPVDYSIMESFGDAFLVELAKYIYDEGKKQGYTFLTLPVVEMSFVKDVLQGEIRIDVIFDDSVVETWQIEGDNKESYVDLIENTSVLPGAVRLADAFQKNQKRKSRCYLEIIKGNNEGKIYVLDKDEIFLGRNGDCEIEVDDLEVSRRHMKIGSDNGRWFVQDLDSTNGTYVNKLKVDRYIVKNGDKIKIGNTVFLYKMEK
ncbi:MAG: DUF3662 and FHA domain-containing protein [Eubacteriales bacterium]